MIDHACDDRRINLQKKEEEVDLTCINYTNETNNLSNNYDEKVSINIMHHLIVK